MRIGFDIVLGESATVNDLAKAKRAVLAADPVPLMRTRN